MAGHGLGHKHQLLGILECMFGPKNWKNETIRCYLDCWKSRRLQIHQNIYSRALVFVQNSANLN